MSCTDDKPNSASQPDIVQLETKKLSTVVTPSTNELNQIVIHELKKYTNVKEVKKLVVRYDLKPKKVNVQFDHAYVNFENEEECRQAVEKLNGIGYKGRTLRVAVVEWAVQNQLNMVKNERNRKSTKDDPLAALSPLECLLEKCAPYQKYPYDQQLKRKQANANQLLSTICGEINKVRGAKRGNPDRCVAKMREIKFCDVIEGYRNKCEFSVGCSSDGEAEVGFRAGKIIETGGALVASPDGCAMISDRMKVIVRKFRDFVRSSSRTPFNVVDHSGFWRQLSIRCYSFDIMVIVTVHPQSNSESELADVKNSLRELFMTTGTDEKPGLVEDNADVKPATITVAPDDVEVARSTSEDVVAETHQNKSPIHGEGMVDVAKPDLLTSEPTSKPEPHSPTPSYMSSAGAARVVSLYFQRQEVSSEPGEPELIAGAPYVYERLLGRRFRISPNAFFQTNTLAAEVLYQTVADVALMGLGLPDQMVSQVEPRGAGDEARDSMSDASQMNKSLNGEHDVKPSLKRYGTANEDADSTVGKFAKLDNKCGDQSTKVVEDSTIVAANFCGKEDPHGQKIDTSHSVTTDHQNGSGKDSTSAGNLNDPQPMDISETSCKSNGAKSESLKAVVVDSSCLKDDTLDLKITLAGSIEANPLGNIEKVLFDICCGTGTIGISMAGFFDRVIGLELCPEAVVDARMNADAAGVGRKCDWVVGKAEEAFYRRAKSSAGLSNTSSSDVRQENIGILDPPRAGLPDKIIRAIREFSPMKRLVYVSCEPKMASKNFLDLCRPASNRYAGEPFDLKYVIPVDMFPHTQLCEWVILFERK